jgi:glycosyltransferase involved in cell wall biosynthesis
MRIGFDTLIENPFSPSSAINYLKDLLRALIRIAPDDELVVFVSRANREQFDISSNENIPARILTQQLQYPWLLKRHRVDVLHALNQIPLFTSTATVCKVCTLHHHVTASAFTEPIKDRWAWLANRLRRAYRGVVLDESARRATRVLANSNATRDLIVQHMKVPRDRVDVVYETVDDRFVPHPDPGALGTSLATKHGLVRPYLLYVSNLWFYKNPDGAIRSFARLRTRYKTDVDLVIVGNDDFGRIPSLEALAQTEGVRDRVRFLGRVPRDELIELYQGAHVVFYPSLAETFGKPVLEGMRVGVPVATSNTSSLPELGGAACLLFDPTDPDDVARVLHAACTDAPLRARLIAAGLQRGAEFSWDATARGTREVCARAVELHDVGRSRS